MIMRSAEAESGPEVVPGFVARGVRSIVVVFAPQTPDRTAAMLSRGPTPIPHLKASVDTLARLGATHIGIACNSAHHFVYEALAGGWSPDVPIVDLIECTARGAAATGAKVVGVLATTGTIRAGLYQSALARMGIRTVVPEARGRYERGAARPLDRRIAGIASWPGDLPLPADLVERVVQAQVADLGEQEGLVMEAIYGTCGIKAGHTRGMAGQLVARVAEALVRRDGAEALILGCTELPLVMPGAAIGVDGRRIPVVDATAQLASGLLGRAGTAGIVGGLGPEATIDLIRKMQGPADLVTLLDTVYRATVASLRPQRDQDHLPMLAAMSPDPLLCARRLEEAGATLLVAAESAAGDLANADVSRRVPVLTGPARDVASIVVRAAAFGRPRRSAGVQ